MNRRAFLVVCLLLAGEAHGQQIVHDPTSNGLRVAEAGRALQQALQQYQQLQRTYQAIAHATDLNGVASAMGGISRQTLPGAGQMTGLLSTGSTGLFGRAGELLGQQQHYRSPAENFTQQEMDRRERITANAQALAAEGLTDMQDRVAKLQVLQRRLEAAQDGTEVAAVQGLIAVEHQNLAAHQAQLQQVRLMLAADDRVTNQRAEQQDRLSLDELRAATAAQRQRIMPSAGGSMPASTPSRALSW